MEGSVVVRAYLALGSNLGDRAASLALARARLPQQGVTVVAASDVDETDPIGPIDQPPFLNQVLAVDTDLRALELLRVIKAIEVEAGRTPGGPRWGPRELDIDVLLYGDEVIETGDLTVPHRELANRDFLLRQLAQLGVSPPSPRR